MSEPTLYEAAYILDPSLEDAEAEELMASLEQLVTDLGGEVVGTRDFRTRRLAYQIDNFTHGTYKLLYFFGNGEIVTELRNEMSIRQPIIRSRVFVANPRAVVGGLEGEEEAVEQAIEAVEAAEAPEAADEAVETAEVEEAPAEEAVETDEAEEATEADSDETPEAEE